MSEDTRCETGEPLSKAAGEETCEIGDTLGVRAGEKRKRRETEATLCEIRGKPIEATEWSITWEGEEGKAVTYFTSEAEYHRVEGRIRRASFEENFTKSEMELITLLLHIDTAHLPVLREYRSKFISDYFYLKRRIEFGRIDGCLIDSWGRHMATFELKADLQALVLEARLDLDQGQSLDLNLGTTPRLNHEVRKLLIHFCEAHETAILARIMNSRWGKVLRHGDGYEHPGEDLGTDFKPSLSASGFQEINYIQNFIRYKKDKNLVRFMDDLTFVLVEVWMRLHDGHELYCGGDCSYREMMGAKIRALYIYGCLNPEQIDGKLTLPRTPLRELVEKHIFEVAPLVAPMSTSCNSKYLRIQALLAHEPEPEPDNDAPTPP